MGKDLKGAPAITHRMKVYGGSMEGALTKLAKESKRAGQREGFQQGFNYALNELSLLERLVGHRIGGKK